VAAGLPATDSYARATATVSAAADVAAHGAIASHATAVHAHAATDTIQPDAHAAPVDVYIRADTIESASNTSRMAVDTSTPR
jgi:hypothetical protein